MVWIFSSMPPAFALSFSASSLVTVFLNSDVAWGRIRSFLCRNGVLAFVSGKVLVLSMPQEHFEGSVDMGDPASSLDARRWSITPPRWHHLPRRRRTSSSRIPLGKQHEMRPWWHPKHLEWTTQKNNYTKASVPSCVRRSVTRFGHILTVSVALHQSAENPVQHYSTLLSLASLQSRIPLCDEFTHHLMHGWTTAACPQPHHSQ
ncbi:uncharacterized protein [Salvelinus alpinus]|uniref:uncharacterized protein isoform X2 n=1 Tax=Salvelinus alpinus TaxID=8036 RepID=UPI0039FCCC98